MELTKSILLMSIIIGSVYCTTYGDGSVTAGNTIANNLIILKNLSHQEKGQIKPNYQINKWYCNNLMRDMQLRKYFESFLSVTYNFRIQTK